MNENVLKIVFIIVFILAIGIFVSTFLMMFSPKLRSKMMKRELKATKNMFQSLTDDLKDLQTTSIKMKKEILDENKDDLESIEKQEASIEGEGIKIKASALKSGLTGDMYCKNCGKKIPGDSIYCKNCGAKL